MRYVAAYLLAVMGGSENPKNAEIEKILSSVGIEVDSEALTRLVKSLNGKSVEEVIAAGREKLCSMPVGGAAAVAAAPAAGGDAGAKKEEAKKEEKKEESESEDDDMGFALFD